ncbi:MAG TPA: FISUMP domain-containing protein [Bacteroidales bacterium]|nr:FISUMP domain-containing protein [Bacteroidales bacterium]
MVTVQNVFSQCIIADSASPICLGGSAPLHVTLQPGCMNGTDSYSFEVIPFDTIPLVNDSAVDPEFKGNTGALNPNHDDVWAGPYPIGFEFCFLNNVFTQYWVGSNGWISFTDPLNKGWTTYTPFSIPSTNSDVPKNAIFAPYQDWYPTNTSPPNSGANNVFHHIISNPPGNSKLIVYWNKCPMYSCTSNLGTFQIVLNQSDFSIENNITMKPECSFQGNSATQGVHNSDGTNAFTVFNRNASSWHTSDESTRFVPNGITWYKGSLSGPVAGYGPSIVVNPTITTKYFAEIQTCTGSTQSTWVRVVVIPPPVITGPANPCFNSVQKYTTAPGMTGYAWSVTGGTVISGGTATADSAMVRWNLPAGPYSVSVNYTYPAIPCTFATPTVFNVTLKSVPDVIFTPQHPSGTWCSQDTVRVVFTSSMAGATFAWNASATPGAIVPPVITGRSGNIIQPFQNTSFTLQTVNFQVQATGNGCTSDPYPYSVQINPVPDVLLSSPSQNICSRGATAPVSISSDVTGAAFNWSYPCNGFITPCPGSGNGNVIPSLTLANSSSTLIKQTVISVTSSIDGCPGSTTVHTVVVNPDPVVTNASLSQDVCLGTPTQQVDLTCSVNPAQFQWSAAPSLPSTTGFPAGQQVSSWIPVQTLTDATNTAGSVFYTIQPSIIMNGLTCSGIATVYTINTRVLPLVTLTGPTPSLACEGLSSTFSVPNQPGCTFTWKVNPGAAGTVVLGQGTSDVTIQWDGNGNPVYTCVSGLTAQGCRAGDSIFFPVRPKPPVAFTRCLDPVTTPEARPYVLRGGIPAGTDGVYSGSGVTLSGGIYLFTPSAVSPPLPKTVTISYTYTNTWGCPASADIQVQVVAAPAFTCGSALAPLKDVRTTPYRSYPTYQKGGRCWMTENLSYGTAISYYTPQTDNCISELYRSTGSQQSAFYRWDELMQYDNTPGAQGLCPPGWHVPTLAEWQSLIDDPSNWGDGLAGGYLHDGVFDARTVGILYQNNTWSFTLPAPLTASMFWTSTADNALRAWARGFTDRTTSMSLYSSGRENAYPVRCVKD